MHGQQNIKILKCKQQSEEMEELTHSLRSVPWQLLKEIVDLKKKTGVKLRIRVVVKSSGVA